MEEKFRILIVEDNPINIAIFEEILVETYELIVVESGEEAIEKASSYQPKIILLDIMMPGIDGYETCRSLRRIPALKRTKIIMVTARAHDSERSKGLAAGADAYITKPFEEEDLKAQIAICLQSRADEDG